MKTNLMLKKKNLIIILIVVVVVVLLIVAFALKKSSDDKKTQVKPPVTKTAEPPITYEETSRQKLNDILANRKPLSVSDQAIKKTLIAGTNPIYKTEDISISYYPVPDTFQVEIITVSIESAKDAAVTWFKSKKLSQNGICNLPIVFYMNTQTSESLRGLGVKLNPLAPGC